MVGLRGSSHAVVLCRLGFWDGAAPYSRGSYRVLCPRGLRFCYAVARTDHQGYDPDEGCAFSSNASPRRLNYGDDDGDHGDPPHGAHLGALTHLSDANLSAPVPPCAGAGVLRRH